MQTMTTWEEALAHALALAARLEGEGQYNIAKLARAAVDSLTRKGAYQVKIPSKRESLVVEVEKAVEALASLGLEGELVAALRTGAASLAEGRLPLIHETPNPYVCRSCGKIVLDKPPDHCPICGAWSATFQEFPPVYWMEAYEPFAALHRLRQTPIDVATMLEGLDDSALNTPPAPGEWAIRNTVAHLRDAQGVLSFRLRLLLEQNNPVLESKAVFQWATDESERPPGTKEIYETYREARRETLALLESLSMADWWRTGRHQEFGKVTLRQQVSYFTAHELTHFPQIQSIRAKFV
ncbi:MAG TPA: DinB family protein [Anaerolineales bacterium]|nr:DinB family protein [Anaerolineales bacterium]